MPASTAIPNVQEANGTTQRRWALTTADPIGTQIGCANHPDKSVQVSGTFGGATCVIEGSNDGANWFILRDPAGANLSFTAAGLKQVLETVAFIRAQLSVVGSGAAVNVDLCGGKTNG